MVPGLADNTHWYGHFEEWQGLNNTNILVYLGSEKLSAKITVLADNMKPTKTFDCIVVVVACQSDFE